MRSDYLFEEIAGGVYKIDEFEADLCYLVVGEKHAALIDCGTGYGDLEAFVRTITDKPLYVLLTHAHTDHVGGMGQFKEAYIHNSDKIMAKIVLKLRKIYYRNLKPELKEKYKLKPSDVAKYPYKTKLLPLNEGDIFDLGGKTLEAFHTPGHTTGHIVFRLPEDKIMFSGDNIMDYLALNAPRATSLETWLAGVKRTVELAKGCKIYCGHRSGYMSDEHTQALISHAEKILEKTKKNALFSKSVKEINKEDKVTICFKSGKIFD